MNFGPQVEAVLNAVFVLYLVISANFFKEIFGCNIQKLFNDNMLVKHILAFFTLYFLITLTNEDLKLDPLFALAVSVGMYMLFLMSVRLNWRLWLIMFVLLIIQYILYIFKPIISEPYLNFVKTLQNVLGVIVVLLIVIGFFYTYFMYTNMKFIDFVIGSNTCQVID